MNIKYILYIYTYIHKSKTKIEKIRLKVTNTYFQLVFFINLPHLTVCANTVRVYSNTVSQDTGMLTSCTSISSPKPTETLSLHRNYRSNLSRPIEEQWTPYRNPLNLKILVKEVYILFQLVCKESRNHTLQYLHYTCK